MNRGKYIGNCPYNPLPLKDVYTCDCGFTGDQLDYDKKDNVYCCPRCGEVIK